MCTVCTALRIMKALNAIHVQFVSCNNSCLQMFGFLYKITLHSSRVNLKNWEDFSVQSPPPLISTLGSISVSYKSRHNLLKQSVTTCFAWMTCPCHQLLNCHECRRRYSELVHSHVFQNCFLTIVYSHFYF